MQSFRLRLCSDERVINIRTDAGVQPGDDNQWSFAAKKFDAASVAACCVLVRHLA